MREPREIELKLELTEPSDAARLRAHDLLRAAGPGESERLKSVYFDTEDLALHESGLSLRIRAAGDRRVQTIKEDGAAAAGLFDRSEWEHEVEGERPDIAATVGTAAEPILARSPAGRGLKPLFETVVDRTTWRIAHDGCEVDLTLDEGTLKVGRRKAPLCEVELELKRGTASDLFTLARTLGEIVPLRVGVMSKSERGYALVDGARTRAVKAGRVPIRSSMTTAEAFQAIARACLRHFRMNEPILIATRSPESLHQARVALRRLRSALSIFGEVVADDQREPIRQGLRDVSARLGEARNLDVFLANARAAEGARAGATIKPGDRLAHVQAQRHKAYDAVIEALEAPGFRRLMLDLVDWIEAGPWLGLADKRKRTQRQQPVGHFAAKVLDRRRAKVANRGRRLDRLDPEARHRVRIEAKKLRYASEFFAGLTEGKRPQKRYKALVAALEDLQACLGELNDIETGRKLEADLARSAGIEQDGDRRDASRSGHGAGEPDEPAQRTAALLASARRAHRKLVEAEPFWDGFA